MSSEEKATTSVLFIGMRTRFAPPVHLAVDAGQTRRNRHANCALRIIALVRLSSHPPTQAYAARRRTQGLSNLEILRCVKRYIARAIYQVLVA
jgi:hypothetical protein